MLTLYTADGGLPLKCDDYYIREIASGYNELIFTVNIHDPAYALIQEEASIHEQSGDETAPTAYLVKAIDGGKNTATVKAQIDLDDWKGSLTTDYNSGSHTPREIVFAVAPQGWAVVDASGLTNRRTIDLKSGTPLDVLEALRSPWPSLTYQFDTATKTVTLVNMANGQNLGAYVTKDLNLKENNYKGKSTGFITRLYAYGKDGLSFSDINGGKPYVDNNEYSSRVICGYWSDERYTVKENLLADAQEKLAEMARPARSYDCSVLDLASISRGKYGFLDFSLFSVVSLIDQTRSRQKIEHRVSERWRYPYHPHKNKVTLSTVAPRIQSQVQQALNNFNNPNSAWAQQQRSAQQAAIENATAQITGAKGGNMRAIYDSAGNWTELVVMNTADIATASKLWRFNLGGFGYSPNGYNGPYTTAITMDGAIVADFITTGTLDASKVNVEHLSASSIDVSDLSAFGATIGGWSIGSSDIHKEIANSVRMYLRAPANPTDSTNAIVIQKYSGSSWTTPFKVTYGGVVTATDVVITGGTVGKLPISSSGDLTGITDTNISIGGISGGSGGSIGAGSVSGFNFPTGVNTNLGYGAAFGQATQTNTSVYPSSFTADYIYAKSFLSVPTLVLAGTTLSKKSEIVRLSDGTTKTIMYVAWG